MIQLLTDYELNDMNMNLHQFSAKDV